MCQDVVTDPAKVAAEYGCRLYDSPEELVADDEVVDLIASVVSSIGLFFLFRCLPLKCMDVIDGYNAGLDQHFRAHLFANSDIISTILPLTCVVIFQVDAVFVLTNMETHKHFAEMAMNAGKHVLCEKARASR